jgi:flagellar hook-associated protein 1 FlgK
VSLTGAFQIGSSALTASQLAIQVTGNNLANAATPGYSRQIAFLSPARSNTVGRLSIGTGVDITDVRRQVDEALQARLNAGVSTEAAATQQHDILSQVESTLGALGDNDLTTQLHSFFNSWSERANLTQSSAVVVQQGQQLADFMRSLRSQLSGQREQVDQQLGASVQAADGLLSQVANLNQAISQAEASGGQANTLRDQRDQALTQLSQYMDVSTVEQADGSVDVSVGSTPVVLGGRSRGIELQRRNDNGTMVVSVNVREDGQQLDVRNGQIGSSLSDRDGAITRTIDKLDTLTSQLIFEVNKLHSTGTNAAGLTTTTGSLSIATADRTRALDDPANQTFAGLPFHATSGGFTVHVKTPDGQTRSVRINVDLDGRDASGAPGTGNDTSAEDIRSALNGIPGLSAQIGPDGKLKIDADPGVSFSFSDDSSGVLAVMGVNSYFTGTDATNIGVRQELKDDPDLLSTGKLDSDGNFVENGAALGIAGLQDQSLSALGGLSLKQSWTETVQQLGVDTAAAKGRADAATMVRENLDAQRAAISGVSVDEESVNMLTYQRQYQAAARFITTIDEMTQTLIALT